MKLLPTLFRIRDAERLIDSNPAKARKLLLPVIRDLTQEVGRKNNQNKPKQ